MQPILRLHDICKTFTDGRIHVPAVRHVSLEVFPGQVVFILGPSGSGKTTLLSMMGGLMHPTSGEVYIDDQDLYHLSDAALSRLRCQKIGFVFQSFNLLNFLSVRKNVEVMLNLAGKRGRAARDRAVEVLRQVQLAHRLDFLPQNLSGGERQRVSIARALANHPQLLLADEPTGSLDTSTGRAVVDLLASMAKQPQCAVVIVTHDNRILDIADRVLSIIDGALEEHFPVSV